MNIAKTFFKTASMLLLAAIMVISGALSYVTQQATTANASSDSLKIKVDNTDVPGQAKQEAKQHFSSYAQALSQIDRSGNNGEFKLGHSFKIYKFNGQEDGNFYYPVMQGDTIKYILTVTPKSENDVHANKNNANYSVRISKFISDELNQYRQNNTPITIFTNKDGYYIEHDKRLDLVMQTKLPNDKTKPSTPAVPNLELKQTVNATQTEATHSSVATKYVNLLPNFQIREQQGNNGWCAGYTMAALLNATKNTSQYRAQDVMHQIHPGLSGQAFQFTGLTADEMIQYGRAQGKNTSYYNGMPSFNMVDQYTKDNKGIAILGKQIEATQGMHAGHAMAVVGNAVTADNQQVIVFWNPWDRDYSLQPADSNVIPVSNGDHYHWYGSVVGF